MKKRIAVVGLALYVIIAGGAMMRQTVIGGVSAARCSGCYASLDDCEADADTMGRSCVSGLWACASGTGCCSAAEIYGYCV